ncbi:MAG TPA: hypothetical protein VD861_19850 [Pyrinomonadaceae bacterium]|nr:hypothetical protein [Pyrinomonadaceae bacterium]
MRLVRVKAPEGKGEEVARLAFEAGLEQVTVHQQQTLKADGRRETKDVVDVETATPTAKAFVDAVMAAPFFDSREYSIAIRQPRSVVSREGPVKLTWPLVEPSVDIFEELWQFSHVTYGFVGRVLIAALFLAYGMIEHKLLIMIAGLLFLPLLPLLLAMGFGAWTRQWRLAGQGLFAFLVATALLVSGGVIVASVMDPPMRYNEHNTLLVGLLISVGVGVAAGLATADDVGRREMIGLAATAQIAILPVWFGVSFVFGFPVLDSAPPKQRALAFAVNAAAIVVTALLTYAFLRMRGEGLGRFARSSGGED